MANFKQNKREAKNPPDFKSMCVICIRNFASGLSTVCSVVQCTLCYVYCVLPWQRVFNSIIAADIHFDFVSRMLEIDDEFPRRICRAFKVGKNIHFCLFCGTN